MNDGCLIFCRFTALNTHFCTFDDDNNDNDYNKRLRKNRTKKTGDGVTCGLGDILRR